MFNWSNQRIAILDFVMAGSSFSGWIANVLKAHDPLNPYAIINLSCAAVLLFIGLVRLGKIKGIEAEDNDEF